MIKKQRIQMVILVLLCTFSFTACEFKTVSKDNRQVFIDYMKEKYGDDFRIQKISYDRDTGDPMIPWPNFLEPYSHDITAKMTLDKDPDTIITVRYDDFTHTFTDDFNHDKIVTYLRQYVYENEIAQIKQVFCYATDENSSYFKINYPNSMEGFYDTNAEQATYAYEYLQKHEVSIHYPIDIRNPLIKIYCKPDEAPDIIKALDKIFLELFRSPDTDAMILFYYKKEFSEKDMVKIFAGNRKVDYSQLLTSDAYMQVIYSYGYRRINEKGDFKY